MDFPSELIGKSNLAVTPAAPNAVFLVIEAKPGSGLYRSDDAGESWQLVSTYASDAHAAVLLHGNRGASEGSEHHLDDE